MKLARIFQKAFIVGLDFGSSAIKVAQFAKRDAGLILINLHLKERHCSEDASLGEKETLPVLKESLRGVVIKKSKFFVSLDCPKTAMRLINAPPMPLRELRDAIQLEAKNYFPFPTDDLYLDFEVVGVTLEKGIKKLQVGVAVSAKKTIRDVISLLRRIGIKPVSLIPAPCALRRLAVGTGVKDNEVRCLVDIGERHSELVIVEGGKPLFSHKIPIGGRDFTQVMTGVLLSDRGETQLTFKEAEKIKREIGIPREGEAKIIDGKISTTEISAFLRSTQEQLVSEIDRCLDYYREGSEGGKIDSLILFGGGASLKGLSQSLSEALGIEVKVGNPFENLKVESRLGNLDSDVSRFAVAIGAALNTSEGINLLPAEIREETKRIFKRAAVQTFVASLILILAFVYVSMKIQLTNFQKRLEVAHTERASLQYDFVSAVNQSWVNQVLAKEPYWEDVFKGLSQIIPEEIYLTHLEMTDHKISMKGVIVSQEREGVLSSFISNLENGIFKNVKLVKTRETRVKSASEFELECWVD